MHKSILLDQCPYATKEVTTSVLKTKQCKRKRKNNLFLHLVVHTVVGNYFLRSCKKDLFIVNTPFCQKMSSVGFPFPNDLRAHRRLEVCPPQTHLHLLPSAFDLTPTEVCWLEGRQCLQAQGITDMAPFAQQWAPAKMQVERKSIGIEGGPCHRTTLLDEAVPWMVSLPRTQNHIPLPRDNLEQQTVYHYLRQGVSPIHVPTHNLNDPNLVKGIASSE
jgi:hypothetical protein